MRIQPQLQSMLSESQNSLFIEEEACDVVESLEIDDPVSKLKRVREIRDMFKFLFLNQSTTKYKHLFTRH